MHVTPRRFNRIEYYRMAEAGIFRPDERVELIEGTVVCQWSQTPAHAFALAVLTPLLLKLLSTTYHARLRAPVVLSDDTELEPDALIVHGTWHDYADHHPRAKDTLLAIEVADSSLAYDRTTKQRLYARHGIPHYWIVNVQDEAVEVYTAPGPSGYAEPDTYRPGDALALPEHPDALLHVAMLFG